MSSSFVCQNCQKTVSLKAIGTEHRNHCPFCVFSVHLDQKKPGDRQADCRGLMVPVALSFKKIAPKKYKALTVKDGELALVHQCRKCGWVTINRIAGDDDEQRIIDLLSVTEAQKEAIGDFVFLKKGRLAEIPDLLAVRRQLWGK
jgi:hypothetical protein